VGGVSLEEVTTIGTELGSGVGVEDGAEDVEEGAEELATGVFGAEGPVVVVGVPDEGAEVEVCEDAPELVEL